MREYPDQSPESIARARAYQQRERQAVREATGVQFDGDGHLLYACPVCGVWFGSADVYAHVISHREGASK